MTQREEILGLLRRAGSRGLCSLEAYRHGPRFFNSRNRVSEMNAAGFRISSEWCDHNEKAPTHVRWTLTREPAAKQLALGAA